MSTALPLNAGTLASPTCWPSTPQALYNEMFARGSALLGDINGVIISDSQPDANDRDKAWLKTSAGAPIYPYLFKYYNAQWVTPHPTPASSSERRLWVGTEVDLETYDGGSSGAVTDASGPMWKVDHAFDGRFPVGAGTVPTSDPPVNIVVGTSVDSGGGTGAYAVTLTEAQGAVGSHTHPFGVSNPGGDDAFFNKNAVTTVTGYTGYYITGSNGNIVSGQTTADLFTSPANNGAGVTATSHPNMPPYFGVYVIMRTTRIYIRAT